MTDGWKHLQSFEPTTQVLVDRYQTSSRMVPYVKVRIYRILRGRRIP
jgi:hypothetical protein